MGSPTIYTCSSRCFARSWSPEALARPGRRSRNTMITRRSLVLLVLLAWSMPGCAAGPLVTERLHVADLLRNPGDFVGAREIPPGPRAEQMQDLATTLRECVIAPEAWSVMGGSLVVDGESLVVRADPETLAGIHKVLADMRRFFEALPAESGR